MEPTKEEQNMKQAMTAVATGVICTLLFSIAHVGFNMQVDYERTVLEQQLLRRACVMHNPVNIEPCVVEVNSMDLVDLYYYAYKGKEQNQ